ncbi:MAG: alpha/beta fold hydrolase [Deltaproteobacteria bacterium]|nr:alpha/beta fold hydrolase [Deltaproteobacteria bacterium]
MTRQFEILAFDQRGLGQTDRPDGPYTMADYARDAHGLLHAVDWDICSVMEVSFGGMVAQEFALCYAHHVKRLVLACTSTGGNGGDSYPLHELHGLPMRHRALRLVPLADTRCHEEWQKTHPESFQALVDQMVSGMRVGADEPGRQQGVWNQLKARMGHDTYSRLPGLGMPVYICGGRYDGITPEMNLRALYDKIPHARLELFEGGHRFLLQDKRAFDRIVAFLEGKLDRAE